MEPGPAEIPPGAPHSLSRLHLPSSPPPQPPPLILHLHPQSRCPRAADKTHRMAGPPQTSRGHLRWHCPPFHWSLRPPTLLVPFALRPSPENTRTLSRLLAPTMFLLLIPLRKKPPVESSVFSQRPACPRGGPGGVPIWAHPHSVPHPTPELRTLTPPTHPRSCLATVASVLRLSYLALCQSSQ